MNESGSPRWHRPTDFGVSLSASRPVRGYGFVLGGARVLLAALSSKGSYSVVETLAVGSNGVSLELLDTLELIGRIGAAVALPAAP